MSDTHEDDAEQEEDLDQAAQSRRVKGNQIFPSGEISPKISRLPPMTAPSDQEDRNECEVAAQKQQDLLAADATSHRAEEVKEKFQAGVKKATAFAEMQRRNSVEEWQAVPESTCLPFTHPNHPHKTRWDMSLAAMIVYSVIMIPFRIAFDWEAAGFWYALDAIVDIFFGLDILVTFRTGYLDQDGKMEWDPWKISSHYLKGWFIIDFLSTVPIDRLAALSANSESGSVRLVKLIRVVRLIRLFKLMKLIKFDEFLERYEILDHNREIITVFSMLIKVTFTAHLMGCGWYAISQGDDTMFNENSWIVAYYSDDDTPFDHVNGTFDGKELPTMLKYTASIYWAVTTMATVGYGDINTQNNLERGFAVFAMLVGATTFGFIIGCISDIIQTSNIEKVKRKDKMSRLTNYSQAIDLPLKNYGLYKQLKKHWEHDVRKRGVFPEAEMLQYMSLDVREACVKKGKYFQLAKQIPVLFNWYLDLEYTLAVLPKLNTMFMIEGEVLFEQSSLGWHTYFVCQGGLNIEIDAYQQPKSNNNTNTIQPDPNEHSKDLVTDAINSVDVESEEEVRKTMAIVKVKNSTGLWINKLVASNQVLGQDFTIPGAGHISEYRAIACGVHNELCSLDRKAVEELVELWPDVVDELSKGRDALKAEITAFKIAHAAGEIREDNSLSEVVGISEEVNTSEQDAEDDMEKGIFHNPSPQELAKLNIIYSESDWKVYWDLFVGLWIVTSVFIVPLRLCFDVEAQGPGEYIDILIDCIFGIDMLLMFRTSYYTVQRQLIYDVPSITKHYLRGSFLIDFITTVPVDRIAKIFVTEGSALRVVKILRVLRLFRLVRLARLLQNGPLFEKFEDMTRGINPSVFTLTFLFFQLLFVAHLIGCIWHGVTQLQFDKSWVLNYFGDHDACGTAAYPLCGTVESVDANLESEEQYAFTTKYLTSVYWALATMTTVGYGDISPHRLSKLEMAVAMFSMLIGTTVFAYVIGELVIAVLNFDPAEKEFKAKKRSLKKFLEDRALPAALSDRARKGLEYFADYSSVFEERALFEEMPEFLLRKVIAYKYSETIQRFTIFPALEKQFIGCCSVMLPMLKTLYAERGTHLFQVGGKVAAAYFLHKGNCRLHCPQSPKRNNEKSGMTAATATEDTAAPVTYKAGDMFGEATLFIPVGARFRLRVGAKALDTSHVLVFARKDFLELQDICPILYTNLRFRWRNKRAATQWIAGCDWGDSPKGQSEVVR